MQQRLLLVLFFNVVCWQVSSNQNTKFHGVLPSVPRNQGKTNTDPKNIPQPQPISDPNLLNPNSQKVGESHGGVQSQSLAPSVNGKIKTLAEAETLLVQIREKLKNQLGTTFVENMAKPGWVPDDADRIHYLKSITKALSPQERVFFTLVSTAFAEDRHNVVDPNDPEDLVGRANMLFTMKIIENRTKSPLAKQFMDEDFLNKNESDKIWGVVTTDRQFTSWNAGSDNLANTIRAALNAPNVPPQDQIAIKRAMAAYRDYSSNEVMFEGFEHLGEGATLMLNRKEVEDLRASYNNPSEAMKLVPWTVEAIMRRPLEKGKHQVGLRVPSFSITIPKIEGSQERTKILSSQIGHWPVYIAKLEQNEMDAHRLNQGGW